MALKLKNAFWIIKNVAEENDFTVDKISDKKYQLHLSKFHGVDFEITANSSGYIQCKQWDENRGEYNRAVYSLRSVTDVISFCSVLVNSSIIRARRN